MLPCALFYGQRLSCCNKKEIGIAKKKATVSNLGGMKMEDLGAAD